MSLSEARIGSGQSTEARRTQLWCPGTAFVTPQGDVRVGRGVGYSSRDPSFRRLCCGSQSGISSWTHVAWLVSRNALTPETIAGHGIILPETLIDREALPHAHRWLREQPLVCVSGATWTRLARDGVRAFRVAFDATGKRTLRFDSRGGARPPTAVTVSLDRLTNAAAEGRGALSLLDFASIPSPIDRALRLLSKGVLDESSVTSAFDARSLIENGYGYRGALEGCFTDVDVVARELGAFDDLFGQVFERAIAMRDVAQRLRRALEEAPPEACAVGVPLYGTARALTVTGLSLTNVERLVVEGVPTRALELPRERCWNVGVVETWSPNLPVHLSLVARARAPRNGKTLRRRGTLEALS